MKPFHFTSLTENGGDPYHDWTDTHNEYDDGKMDGFYTNDGHVAMGYFDSSDLPYYYSLFPKFTPCAPITSAGFSARPTRTASCSTREPAAGTPATTSTMARWTIRAS